MPQLIETVGLSKTYRLGEVSVKALQSVTLSIARGSFVAIMGASGSGKSTLLNILGCLDRPTLGHYWLDGIPVEDLDRDQLRLQRRDEPLVSASDLPRSGFITMRSGAQRGFLWEEIFS